MGSRGCVFLRVTNQTLVWLGIWKGKLTQLSGKQFKYCLSHRVQRCWFLAFRQPYLSAWSLVGLLWFRLSDHPHWWQSGGRGAEPRQEAFGDVLNTGSGHYASLGPVARLGCPCGVRVRWLHPGPEPLAVASTSYPSRAWPQPPSALPGWFPIYWTSLYFLLALKFMIFFPPRETLAEDFVPWEKSLLRKARNPLMSSAPGLSLVMSLHSTWEPAGRWCWGNLPVVGTASCRCFSGRAAYRRTCWSQLSWLSLYVDSCFLPHYFVCLSLFLCRLLAPWSDGCVCGRVWRDYHWLVKYGWSEQGRVWYEKYCNLLVPLIPQFFPAEKISSASYPRG